MKSPVAVIWKLSLLLTLNSTCKQKFIKMQQHSCVLEMFLYFEMFEREKKSTIKIFPPLFGLAGMWGVFELVCVWMSDIVLQALHNFFPYICFSLNTFKHKPLNRQTATLAWKSAHDWTNTCSSHHNAGNTFKQRTRHTKQWLVLALHNVFSFSNWLFLYKWTQRH